MYMSYFFILGITVFTFYILAQTLDNWEENVPNCLSCPMYYLTRAFLSFTTTFMIGMVTIGFIGWWKCKEDILKFLMIVGSIWFVTSFFIPIKINDMGNVKNNLWKLKIRKNRLKIEETSFFGTEEEASVRLYEEIEKVYHLYLADRKIKMQGTTSPRLIQVLKDEEDGQILCFRGALKSPKVLYEFEIIKE